MIKLTSSLLACPLDGLHLQPTGGSVRCERGHCFDFDRKGVLNLLPVQFKKSLSPGDSKEMVVARQKFLDSGTYRSIADKLLQLTDALAPTVIFDAGCGEGYYTALLAAPERAVIGMDISKEAINAAARRHKDVQWLVGTNKTIPMLDHTVDCIVCLFGFPVWNEFRRVLKPGGNVLMVDPGPEHLIEMRRILYPEIREKTSVEKIVEGFTLKHQERMLQTVPPPSPELLAAQIAMTPHHFRTAPEQKQAAIHAVYPQMTLDVLFSVYS